MTEPGDLEAVERIVERLRAVYAGWVPGTPVEAHRRDWDALFADPGEARFEPFAIGAIPAARVTAAGADPDRCILYFHGGGFRLGSLASHRALMGRLSAASGCTVVGIAYRLAPGHRFPAPIEDAQAGYGWAFSQFGGSARVALAGDSAGGGLAVSLMLALKRDGRPMPAAAFLMSPWTDMTASGESYGTRAAADPIHQREMIRPMARLYLGRGGDPNDPLASPLFGDLAGLPPLLVQVGDRETVLDDSVRLVERARAAGVAAELAVFDGMIHVFQAYPELAAARAALAEAGAFLARHLGAVSPDQATSRSASA